MRIRNDGDGRREGTTIGARPWCGKARRRSTVSGGAWLGGGAASSDDDGRPWLGHGREEKKMKMEMVMSACMMKKEEYLVLGFN